MLCTISASSLMRITWKSLGYRRPLERNGTWFTMPWLVVMKGPVQGLVTCHAWAWESLKMGMDASWLWILITLPASLGIMVKPHTGSLCKNTHTRVSSSKNPNSSEWSHILLMYRSRKHIWKRMSCIFKNLNTCHALRSLDLLFSSLRNKILLNKWMIKNHSFRKPNGYKNE